LVQTLDETLSVLRSSVPLLERYGIAFVKLFGSAAEDDLGEESDVDLIYDFLPGKADMWSLLDLQEGLEEAFGRRVDLVSEEFMSPILRDYLRVVIPVWESPALESDEASVAS
jgi:predicted nucleotidyltransferase